MLKAVVVGVGPQALNVHIPALVDLEQVKIEAICDLHTEAMAGVKRRFNVGQTYTDYNKMLDEIRPDIAYVLTMPNAMTPIVLDAIDQNCHVFMEKPSGRNTNEARQIAAAAEKANVKTLVAFNRRYMPVVQQVQEMIGDRQLLHVSWYRVGYDDGIDINFDYWKNFENIHGADYMLLDNVHSVDFLRDRGGEVSNVMAVFENFGRNHDVNWTCNLSFTNGGTGTFYTSLLAGAGPVGHRETIELHYEKVSAYIESMGGGIFAEVRFGREEIKCISSPRYRADSLSAHGIRAEHEHFIDCIVNDKTPMTSIEDSLKTMELIDRIRTAAKK